MPRHDEAYRIYYAIQRLPRVEREYLWELLHGAFPKALKDTDPSPDEVWDDPNNGFSDLQINLLAFLLNFVVSEERKVLKHLWPGEWDSAKLSMPMQKKLRQRLRKLEQRTKELLHLHKSDWILRRPGWHKLELRRDESY
jgi:hypothetical protein